MNRDTEKLKEAAGIARREAERIGFGDRAADFLLQTADWLEARASRNEPERVIH